MTKEGFSSWFKENTPKEGLTENTTFTIQFLIDAWNNGYNKAKEDVKHDLMIKLKDDGIVKPLKDSILRNERLSSQEQQELCSWIECAMDFGENLDECSEKLEEAKNLIEELASSLSVVGECDEEECELINKAQKFINKPIF